MAQYTKATDSNGTVRYKDGTKFVKGADVPGPVKESLAGVVEGTIVDELGDVVDPSTETDEGTEDEVLPTKQAPVEDATVVDEDADEDEVAEDAEIAEEADEPATVKVQAAKKVKYQIGDMGFPALNGKTVSIFSDVPHETVKNINGILVPVTMEEYKTKSDTEIMVRLKELGKI